MRLIGKWLHAGVMEEGVLTHPETGVPQGGVVSPVFANIFFHHVVDEWYANAVRPRMTGRCFLIRCADDCVSGCAREADARRIMDVLPKRFGRCGLTIHPTKTALMALQKPDVHRASPVGNDTGDFLGMTHDWTTSRRGFWVIKRRTARKRLCRTRKALWQWCRIHRHTPLHYQYHMRCLKLRGHYQYDGLRGNLRLLKEVYRYAEKVWQDWLSRRSRTSTLRWEKFRRLLETSVLPTPKIVHTI